MKEALAITDPLQPMNKTGMPEDIAKLAAFLIDNDQSGFITGCDYEVDGGAATSGGFKSIKGNPISDLFAYNPID